MALNVKDIGDGRYTKGGKKNFYIALGSHSVVTVKDGNGKITVK